MGRQIVGWSRRPQARKRPCDREGNRPGDHEPRSWRATSFRGTGPKLAGDPFRGLLATLDALGHADSVIGVAGKLEVGQGGRPGLDPGHQLLVADVILRHGSRPVGHVAEGRLAGDPQTGVSQPCGF